MSHPDEGVLQEFLDGELAPEAGRGVEAHAAECATCRARLEAMRATMLEADGLVGRLQLEPTRREGWQAGSGRTDGTARRFRLSMGQLGLAAGLLVAVTAGMFVTMYPRDYATRVEAAPPAGRRDAALAERSMGDTFRLRAGGVEEATVGQAEAREVEAPRAPRELRKSVARQEKDAGEGTPVAADAPATAPDPQVQANAEAEVAARQAAAPPAPAAAAAPPQKIEGNYMPTARPRTLESAAVVRPRAIGALVPIRVDTLPGTFRSSYRLGDQVVVLEESVRPIPAGEEARDEMAGLAAKAATSEYRWELRGTQLRLSGPLSRDSLIALSALVR